MNNKTTNRRRFLGTAAITLAATQFGLLSSAIAGRAKTKSTGGTRISPWVNASYGPLKQVNAGLLNIGYADEGPATGPVVILLHGWPYDIYSFVDIPRLYSGGKGLSGDRAVSARLWYDKISLR